MLIVIAALLLFYGISPAVSSFEKCKGLCVEIHSECSQSSQNYGKLVQCALDMSDCKEGCYKRRLNTIQLRLAVIRAANNGLLKQAFMD